MESSEALGFLDNENGFSFQEKIRKENYILPYRKPTQVDWSRRPRRSGDTCLRNSAKKLDVISRDVLPYASRAAAKEYSATVYLKHRSLQRRKPRYRG